MEACDQRVSNKLHHAPSTQHLRAYWQVQCRGPERHQLIEEISILLAPVKDFAEYLAARIEHSASPRIRNLPIHRFTVQIRPHGTCSWVGALPSLQGLASVSQSKIETHFVDSLKTC
jgi:hypothetical protein